ncbi:MAG: family 2 glycosyl transferase, partial [Planctomycetes bacterium]|nr:family 2 glycosyl transferase [Planctomycetota bacterium]
KPRDILIFCGQDWWYHNRAHSDFQLMTRAAKHRKVLLVNSIGMRMPMPGRSPLPFKRIFRKLKSMLRAVRRPLPDTPDFTVMTPILFPFYGSEKARQFNANSIRRQVARVAKRMGMVDPHIIVTVPTAWDVAKEMPRSSLIYNRSDKHSAFGEADQGLIADLERELLANSDGVLYSSRAFLESERELTGDRAFFLDHGVDVEHFRERGRTGALDGLGCKRPIVGFFGGLDDYVIDFDLLERVAVERPDYSLVLIGDATLSMERLTRHPNVRHLGFRPYSEIPDLGADFDVSIMPWLDNDWIRHCNPIKLKEYLALGQQVVTTWFPEAEHYLDHLHVGRTGDEFLQRIDEVVAGKKSPGDRAALLERSTWDDRTEQLIAYLDSRNGATRSASTPQPAGC